MKKFITVFLFFLFISFNMNTISAHAIHKNIPQGFYSMNDIGLYEGQSYSIANTSQHNEGLFIIVNSAGRIQQLIHIKPASQYKLIPLLPEYQFIVFGDIEIKFSLSGTS